MTRQHKTPRQRAEEQLAVADRAVERLYAKEAQLAQELEAISREHAAAVRRRDHYARAHRLDEIRGRDLACWCPLEDEHGNRFPCHADVLLEIANGGDGQ